MLYDYLVMVMFTKLLQSRFFKFLISGGLNTLICLLLYWILIHNQVNYILASTIMFIFGVMEGYILSAIFIFKHKINFLHLVKYTSVYLSSYVLNIAILASCVELIGLSHFMGQVFTSALVAVLNYFLVKIFVFRQKTVNDSK